MNADPSQWLRQKKMRARSNDYPQEEAKTLQTQAATGCSSSS
jgi:hypothetical protein